MAAYLIVRAEVAEADRTAFDAWYQNEHLPDAVKAFGTVSAMRGGSDVDHGVHLAFYEFPTLERAREVTSSDAIKGMIAEFDRVWQDRVQRTREVVEIKHTL